MPSLARRRDLDGRRERFESEVRTEQLAKPRPESVPLYTCDRCHHLFEERSKNCPRCDKRSMFELRPIPERHRAEAQRNAERRALRKVRGTL